MDNKKNMLLELIEEENKMYRMLLIVNVNELWMYLKKI